MFGGLLDRCQLELNDLFIGNIVPYKLLKDHFQERKMFQDVRAITSQPYQLCFCVFDQQSLDCSVRKSIKIYRGQPFNITLLALDQFQTSIPTEVIAHIQKTARLKLNQSSQFLRPICSNLTYSLFSTQKK